MSRDIVRLRRIDSSSQYYKLTRWGKKINSTKMKLFKIFFLIIVPVFGGSGIRSKRRISQIYGNLCNDSTCAACKETMVEAFHFENFESRQLYNCHILFQLPKCCDSYIPLISAEPMAIQAFLI